MKFQAVVQCGGNLVSKTRSHWCIAFVDIQMLEPCKEKVPKLLTLLYEYLFDFECLIDYEYSVAPFLLNVGCSGSCNIRLGWCSLENPVAGRHHRALSQVCRQLPPGHVCLSPVSHCTGAWRRFRTFAPAAEATPMGQ